MKNIFTSKKIIAGALAVLFLACASNGHAQTLHRQGQANDSGFEGKTASAGHAQLASSQTNAAGPATGQVAVRFSYTKQSGPASNQFAVWVQTALGSHMVKTLYATRFTANGGYKTRSDSIPVWVQASKLAGMGAGQADAISGATPKAGVLEYIWDLTDDKGNPVPGGEYTICVEGTLRWKNQVMYTANVYVGGPSFSKTAGPAFRFESDGQQPALTENSPESGMIRDLAIEYAAKPDPAGGAEKPVTVYLNGKQLEFDVPPEIINGRAMVPLRLIAEAMRWNVNWDGATQGISIFSRDEAGTYAAMRVGGTTMTRSVAERVIDGKTVPATDERHELDVPPMIKNGRTLVPIRAVSEGLGAGVEWDGQNNRVNISTN